VIKHWNRLLKEFAVSFLGDIQNPTGTGCSEPCLFKQRSCTGQPLEVSSILNYYM